MLISSSGSSSSSEHRGASQTPSNDSIPEQKPSFPSPCTAASDRNDGEETEHSVTEQHQRQQFRLELRNISSRLENLRLPVGVRALPPVERPLSKKKLAAARRQQTRASPHAVTPLPMEDKPQPPPEQEWKLSGFSGGGGTHPSRTQPVWGREEGASVTPSPNGTKDTNLIAETQTKEREEADHAPIAPAAAVNRHHSTAEERNTETREISATGELPTTALNVLHPTAPQNAIQVFTATDTLNDLSAQNRPERIVISVSVGKLQHVVRKNLFDLYVKCVVNSQENKSSSWKSFLRNEMGLQTFLYKEGHYTENPSLACHIALSDSRCSHYPREEVIASDAYVGQLLWDKYLRWEYLLPACLKILGEIFEDRSRSYGIGPFQMAPVAPPPTDFPLRPATSQFSSPLQQAPQPQPSYSPSSVSSPRTSSGGVPAGAWNVAAPFHHGGPSSISAPRGGGGLVLPEATLEEGGTAGMLGSVGGALSSAQMAQLLHSRRTASARSQSSSRGRSRGSHMSYHSVPVPQEDLEVYRTVFIRPMHHLRLDVLETSKTVFVSWEEEEGGSEGEDESSSLWKQLCLMDVVCSSSEDEDLEKPDAARGRRGGGRRGGRRGHRRGRGAVEGAPPPPLQQQVPTHAVSGGPGETKLFTDKLKLYLLIKEISTTLMVDMPIFAAVSQSQLRQAVSAVVVYLMTHHVSVGSPLAFRTPTPEEKAQAAEKLERLRDEEKAKRSRKKQRKSGVSSATKASARPGEAEREGANDTESVPAQPSSHAQEDKGEDGQGGGRAASLAPGSVPAKRMSHAAKRRVKAQVQWNVITNCWSAGRYAYTCPILVNVIQSNDTTITHRIIRVSDLYNLYTWWYQEINVKDYFRDREYLERSRRLLRGDTLPSNHALSTSHQTRDEAYTATWGGREETRELPQEHGIPVHHQHQEPLHTTTLEGGQGILSALADHLVSHGSGVLKSVSSSLTGRRGKSTSTRSDSRPLREESSVTCASCPSVSASPPSRKKSYTTTNVGEEERDEMRRTSQPLPLHSYHQAAPGAPPPPQSPALYRAAPRGNRVGRGYPAAPPPPVSTVAGVNSGGGGLHPPSGISFPPHSHSHSHGSSRGVPSPAHWRDPSVSYPLPPTPPQNLPHYPQPWLTPASVPPPQQQQQQQQQWQQQQHPMGSPAFCAAVAPHVKSYLPAPYPPYLPIQLPGDTNTSTTANSSTASNTGVPACTMFFANPSQQQQQPQPQPSVHSPMMYSSFPQSALSGFAQATSPNLLYYPGVVQGTPSQPHVPLTQNTPHLTAHFAKVNAPMPYPVPAPGSTFFVYSPGAAPPSSNLSHHESGWNGALSEGQTHPDIPSPYSSQQPPSHNKTSQPRPEQQQPQHSRASR